MLKHLSYLFIFCVISSCAQRSEEKVREAIDVAQTYLSQEKCNEAIELLEEIGRQPKNAVYLQVLASAYACQANFRTVEFIADDLPRILPTSLFQSLTLFTHSVQPQVDSDDYQSLRTALEVLQGTDKQENRNELFGPRKGGDVGVQILILSLVQFGKFLNYYGNVDVSGAKGAGTAHTNNCFLNYSNPAAVTFVTTSGETGACTAANNGHPDMAGAELHRRLCEGSTLIANIIDVIRNIDLSSSSDLAVLEDLSTTIADYESDADAAGVGHILDMTSQSECEALISSPTEMNNMENYYATVFEVGLQ